MIPHTKTVETIVKITYHGTDLAKAREQAGVTQEQLSVATGIAQQHISDRYERPGEITVHEHTFQRILDALKSPPPQAP
jgi:predicted transcriptional regulator